MKTTITYGQIEPLLATLNTWWDKKGLPMTLQRQLVKTRAAILAEAKTYGDLKQKLIDEHALKDDDGKYIDTSGNDLKEGQAVVWRDSRAAKEAWLLMDATEFDVPGIDMDLVEEYADLLEMSPAKMAALILDDDHSLLVVNDGA